MAGELQRSGRAAIAIALGACVAVAMAFALLGAAPARAEECGTSAVTPYGPCGMDLEGAFSQYTSGSPQEIVAYIEGGINWHIGQAKELVNSIYVNWHELPVPCEGENMIVGGVSEPCHTVYSSSVGDYDVNHDGVVNASDWSEDPRVPDSNGNGYVDPEDLIAAFSPANSVNHDGSGYLNDISGWDFYDHQNDPATEDSTYEHSDDQMLVIHRECPKCMIMPVKAGEEALDTTDDLAKAWLFAADEGANVIVSVTADLGYSSFMREAIDYLEKKGVAMLESSNDFDSTDHQGGMFWPYVIPGNGAVASISGDEWIRSDLTSWGAHNVLTGATTGGSTSESTPTLGGAIALLQSYGIQAAKEGLISSPLNGPETEQELIATARRITSESLAWPGGPGEWNPQYGYGIPNVDTAMKEVAAGNVAPVPRIESPAWYSLYDPTKESEVPVGGTITAPRSPSFKWVLQAGLGGDPQSWFTVGSGSGSSSYTGSLGTLKLSEIPESFWKAAFSLSKTKELESAEQYAVTLRVTVTDASGRSGVDRRAINVVHDPTWVSGFPVKLSSSGESQPALADLEGTGRLDAVFGTADGYVDAIDPKTGEELPGWPVHTGGESVLVAHEGVEPGYEPIISDVAVGDLEHNGELSVVATTVDGKVFAWNGRGELETGWPQTCDTGVSTRAIPRPALPYTRLPVQGVADGGPVLYDLSGSGELDVIVAGWDGYLHVWEPDGTNAPGWPVKVALPEGFTAEPEYVLVNDEKLDSPPAIAYLEGPEKEPDLVVRPQYTETKGSGVQLLPYGFVFAYHANGSPVGGWPVKLQGTLEYYGSAQEFVTEGSVAPIAGNVSGKKGAADEVAVGPQFSPPYLISGSGHVESLYGAESVSPVTAGFTLPISFASSPVFGKVGSKLALAVPELTVGSFAGALQDANSGEGLEQEEAAYPATGGKAPLKDFPEQRQGSDFLGEPMIAPVSKGTKSSLVSGGDSDALTAYTSKGTPATGFPKWTTGWTLYAPTAGDLLSEGDVDLVSVTREGYLFAWSTSGEDKGNTQWWRAQHDEWNTGNYGAVTRPPGAARNLSWNASHTQVSFTAPGSTWYSGKPSSYRVTLAPSDTTVTDKASAAAGKTQRLKVPSGTTGVTVQAVGPTGLLGLGESLE